MKQFDSETTINSECLTIQEKRERLGIFSENKKQQTMRQGHSPSTPNEVLIAAMYILANDIESADGVANAAIVEAAQRLRSFLDACISAKTAIRIYLERSYDPMQKSKLSDAIKMLEAVI